jgi:hypothetical protein
MDAGARTGPDRFRTGAEADGNQHECVIMLRPCGGGQEVYGPGLIPGLGVARRVARSVVGGRWQRRRYQIRRSECPNRNDLN